MRKIIIAPTPYLIPCDEVHRPPGVRRWWRLPRACTFIEMDDPVFETTETLHPPSSSLAGAMMQEAALFAPYYRHVRSLADVLTLKLVTNTASYHLITSSHTLLQWPSLTLFTDLESEQIQLTCQFPDKSPAELERFTQIVKEWQRSMRRLGVLKIFERIDLTPLTYVALCQFIHSGEEASVALFMMLSACCAETAIESLKVSPPIDSKLLGAMKSQTTNGGPVRIFA